MNKPTAAEILQIALEPDIDLEVARVLAMSDEEIRASLKSRGHDLRVLEAEADILWSMNRSKKTRAGFIAGGIGLASSTVVALAAAFAPAATPLVLATGSAPPPTPAEALRDEALDACNKADWATCVDKLDRARVLDPLGDERTDIVQARGRADRARKP